MKIAEKEKFEQANVFGTGAPNTGYRHHDPGKRQALARREERQLVFPYRSGSAG